MTARGGGGGFEEGRALLLTLLDRPPRAAADVAIGIATALDVCVERRNIGLGGQREDRLLLHIRILPNRQQRLLQPSLCLAPAERTCGGPLSLGAIALQQRSDPRNRLVVADRADRVG